MSPYAQDGYWTDSIIKVTVPSAAFSMSGSFDFGHTAGSGIVRLDIPGTPPLSYLESEPIEVRYSVFNARFSDTSAVSLVLGDENGLGGLTFHYDIAVPDSMRNVFDNALLQWNCATNVNLRMGTNQSVTTSGVDGINSVRFAPASEFNANTLAFTEILASERMDTCQGFITSYLYVREIDIAFKDSVNWHYDTQNESDTSQIDMLWVALHELGHAHLIGHVLDTSKVMFYRYLDYPPRTPQSADVEAGLYIMSLSTTQQCPPNVLPMNPINVDCSGIPQDVITYSTTESGITAWPIPLEGYLSILFDSDRRGYGQLTVRNVLGQPVIIESGMAIRQGENRYGIETEGLTSGVYFLTIEIADLLYRTKLVKQ